MPKLNYTLFDPEHTEHLLPLAYTRSVADFRLGIFTIREKWEKLLGHPPDTLTRSYLQPLYTVPQNDASIIYLNGAAVPDDAMVQAVHALLAGQSLVSGEARLAFRSDKRFDSLEGLYAAMKAAEAVPYEESPMVIRRNWNIFHYNGAAIRQDIPLTGCKAGDDRAGDALQVRGASELYIEPGAVIEGAILNASEGPVYIGRNAHIMDGAVLRGPVAIGANAVIKMGAKVYGDTAIGPWCKVGGEVSNSVLFAYSNKGHDGFLGNSVLGEWCNLGADTNTSNLKNNYSEIQCWDYAAGKMTATGLQFCGLIMGDHGKSGINTMFNTGTVAGVAANVFGGGFPPKFMPSFAWGGKDGIAEFQLDKALEMADRMMQRRKVSFTDVHKNVLKHIFGATAAHRSEY